jgi:hypothetical protein
MGFYVGKIHTVVFWVTTIRNFMHSEFYRWCCKSKRYESARLTLSFGFHCQGEHWALTYHPPANHYRKQQLSYQIRKAFVKYNHHSSYTGLQPYCTVYRYFTESTGLLSLNRHSSRTGWAQLRDFFWDLR